MLLPTSTFHAAGSAPTGSTLSYQEKLPKLPIPPLEDTCRRYLKALEGLQDEKEHEMTREAVQDFLDNDGPRIQEKLKEWARTKDRCGCVPLTRSILAKLMIRNSYIEEFW